MRSVAWDMSQVQAEVAVLILVTLAETSNTVETENTKVPKDREA